MSRRVVLLLFLQVHLMAAMSYYAIKIIESTQKGHWEPIAAGCLLEAILVWVYLKGLSFSRGKDLVDILQGMLRRWGTRLLLFPFLLFLIFHGILLVRHQIFEINIIVLEQTPLWATSLIYTILPCYAAYKGISVIIRMSAAICILYIPFVLFSLVISYKNFDVFNAFPIWDSKFTFFMHPSFYTSMFAFTGFLFLGMLSLDKPLTMKELWPVLGILLLFFLAVVYVPLFIFGHETALLLEHPALIASDSIDIEWVVFDWLPTFFIVSASALGIPDAAVTFWMLMFLIRRLFYPFQEKWLVIILGATVYALSLMIPNLHTLNRYDSVNTLFSLYSIIIIPLATFLAGLWQRRRIS